MGRFKKTPESEPDGIEAVCAQLAQTCVQSAKRAYSVELDFSLASLDTLDSVLQQMHEENLATPISAEGLGARCFALGAYIGEVLRREAGQGRWEKDSSFGSNTFPLTFGNDQSVFPMSWAEKRIVNGPEDNVVFKAKVWLSTWRGEGPFSKASGP
jgi:hypothetical protein